MYLKSLFIAVFLFSCLSTQAQFTTSTKQGFNTGDAFIENIGQYGQKYEGQEEMGAIMYGYEGHTMPILFTQKGIIFLQRKVKTLSHEEKEKLEKKGVPEDEIERSATATDKAITMQWLGANDAVQIITEDKTTAYHTYGMLPAKAYGYKKITYKNLYDGINLVYSFTNSDAIGFEYSLEVAAGADISQIKMQYGGAVKKIKINKQGKLIIDSDIEGIEQSTPITFYRDAVGNDQLANGFVQSTVSNEETTIKQNTKHQTPNNENQPITTYKITKNQITFELPKGYDKTKPLTIDPFVSSTSNLDGLYAGKASDIDYDYAGNVYVTGGGDPYSNRRLAKYNANGVLQWTFNGVLNSPMWQFGLACGGWVVEKLSGKVYLGQGVTAFVGMGLGTRTIRLTTDGLYDNYITTANVNFQENWKMIWNCNNGTPQIFICGGGVNSNTNLAVLQLPSTNFASLNITGILYPGVFPNTGGYQDIADCVIDPSNGTMYSIFASAGHPPLNNKIYCNAAPYAATSIVWNSPLAIQYF
jgi:hypothetical protein